MLPELDFGSEEESQNKIPELDFSKKKKSKGIIASTKEAVDKFIMDHIDELAQKKPGILNPNPEQNPVMAKSFLPEAGPSVERYLGEANVAPSYLNKAAMWGYNNLVRPIASPLGILTGTMMANPSTEPIPNPSKLNFGNIAGDIELPTQRRLALPPAPQDRFIAGPSGAGGISSRADVTPDVAAKIAGLTEDRPVPQGTSADLVQLAEQKRVQNLKYTQAQQYPGESIDVGTVGPYENTLPPQSGDVTGGFSSQTNKTLPYPLNVVPNKVRPRATQTDILRNKPNVEPSPITNEDITFSSGEISEPQTPPELSPMLPSAAKGKPIIEAQILEPPPIKGKNITPKEAIQRWAWGRDAAKERGKIAADEFKDLQDPTHIDQFQAGNRTGPLAKVQQLLDDTFKKEKAAGILTDERYKDNYLRQYWDMDASSPEAIAAFSRSRIARTPGFAKESTFETYAQGKAAGMIPKYSTIPEIVEARVAESERAIKNKELYDWLDKNQYIKEGGVVQSPDTWKLIGPHKEELQKYIQNYMGEPNRYVKPVADVFSLTKNISLGGGAPGTKYNMHAWNTARADAKLNGYISAGRKLFSDPTGNKAEQWIANMPKEERALIPDLIEYGWTYRPIEDMGKEVNVLQHFGEGRTGVTGTLARVGGKGIEKVQNVFEKPLFEKALPALKIQRTLEAFHSLEPELGREAALKAAAKIGNEFYGGVNKSLRDKTVTDLSRIAFLAPDWLESRLRLAASEWKGTAKTLTGQGTPVDKIYAKSFARGSAMTGLGMVTGGGIASQVSKLRNRDIAAIPMGDVTEGVHRQLPTMTSADEGQRIPVQVPLDMYRGNPAALSDLLIKNRISIPAKSILDAINNEDTFGNPLRGKTKYGKDIPFMEGAKNIAVELSRPFQHQVVQGLIGWLKGTITPEEAVSMGLELPTQYSRDKALKKTKSAIVPELRFK